MVTFIPPYIGEELKSNAEKKMYDVLQQLDMEMPMSFILQDFQSEIVK